ncbi:hypothetical protein SAY86_019158 [Trapa natans]|uniref:Uncharacterized protein n=1 Tax=Trapa natans TaxID=22666 RepID=A0AAN7R1L9_TRANT|nr:hypothetical protein SAY86_019158 [Trapa natans]
MASGSGFGSDDILCSYEDYGLQDSSNGGNSEPGTGTDSTKDFRKSRLARSMCDPPAYTQPQDSLIQDVGDIVDKSMKKYSDNLMRVLEGLSSRLSQLELYCYNLDKSIGQMRSEMGVDHGDADTKLMSLEKHLQEVHRSVQILRDKQEIADTQNELAKFLLSQKDSSSGNSLSGEERASTPATEMKKIDNAYDTPNLQLALALPHQVPPIQSVQPLPQAPPHNVSPQQQPYYLSLAQIPNPSGAPKVPQIHYVLSEPQGRSTQLQEVSELHPQSTQPQISQMLTLHPFSQYQHQWYQQLPQQMPSTQQQSSLPPQMRGPPLPIYSTYPHSQPANQSLSGPLQEPCPSSIPMQMSYSGVPPSVSSHREALPYGYAGPGRIIQQKPTLQSIKVAVMPNPGDCGYAAGSQTAVLPGSGIMLYEADGRRSFHHEPPQQVHFSQSQAMYHPSNAPPLNPQANPPNNFMVQDCTVPPELSQWPAHK